MKRFLGWRSAHWLRPLVAIAEVLGLVISTHVHNHLELQVPLFPSHEHQAHMVQHINTGKSLINKPKDVISRTCEYLRENHSSFLEVEDFILQEEGFFP